MWIVKLRFKLRDILNEGVFCGYAGTPRLTGETQLWFSGIKGIFKKYYDKWLEPLTLIPNLIPAEQNNNVHLSFRGLIKHGKLFQ